VAEKKKTKFVISKESTVAIYNDGDRDMLDKIGGHEENRASHVDPLHPPAALAWLASAHSPVQSLQEVRARTLGCVLAGRGKELESVLL
jgi:hypothetical protein